ncbi:MAG: PAS domain-containing sensor histidine kinase [Campylobacterota bacterium]|nr:PAS domain-containing sensor histidine kinase [Campylobacterota bacterium]
MYNKNDENTSKIVSFQDITQIKLRNKQLENSLVEKSKELESVNKLFIDSKEIINNYADVSKTDLRGTITYVSKMFCATTGYTEDELIGKCHNIVKSPNKTKEFYREMWETIEKNDIYTGTIENKTKDGKLISFDTMIKPDFDENGIKIGYIAFRKNITNEKLLQKLVSEQIDEIRKKDKLLHEQSKIESMGKMIENISHQWRQPLSVISTVASGLIVKFEYDMVDKEDAISNLHILDESSQFLSKTIDDFRDFFKKDKIRKEFNLKDTIKKSIDLVQIPLKESSINLIVDFYVDNILIDGYENELIQSLVNMLNNSKDILELREDEDRYIFVSLKSTKNDVIITIYDNGGGCEENIISNIFEPYFTTKHQSQGTGIGLYMTQEIVSKHFCGSIAVSNKEFEYNSNSYIGACFEIKLPI